MNCPDGLECASSLKIDHITQVQGILNIKRFQKYIIGSKVMAILLNGWILPVGWDARRSVCAWHIWGSVSLGYSLRLNAEFVARAWQILGSLVVGVKIILKFVILFFNVPCMKFKNKNWKNVQNQSSCGSALSTALTNRRWDIFNHFLEVKLKHLEAR